jgi:endonuclease/exonuclease/phosphatase family metal-dependent hydrolase
MRLATYNILHGQSPDDRAVDPDRFASAVASLNADVLGLQEVDHAQPRTRCIDFTAIAAEAMGAVAQLYAPALHGTPGGLWTPALDSSTDRPSFGISLLSRFPVLRWEVRRLPWIGAGFPVRLPRRGTGEQRGIMLREEPRLAIVAHLDVPGGPRAVVNTHLTYVPGWGRRQLRTLRNQLAGIDGPLALMGDLNMFGNRSLASVKTFPAGTPRVQLDHILVRGDWGKVLSRGAVRLEVSDHRALVVDVSDAPAGAAGRE